MERFWNKVDRSDGCWEWLAGRAVDGYGAFWFESKTQPAHRVSWILNKGPLPRDMCVCHKCDNPGCVKPDHLFLGTTQANTADKVSKGRQAAGDSHGMAILNREKVKVIRRNLGKISQRRLAEMFGVHFSVISLIKQGKSWRDPAEQGKV